MALSLVQHGLSLKTIHKINWILVVTSLEFNMLLYFSQKTESVHGNGNIQYKGLDQNFNNLNNSG